MSRYSSQIEKAADDLCSEIEAATIRLLVRTSVFICIQNIEGKIWLQHNKWVGHYLSIERRLPLRYFLPLPLSMAYGVDCKFSWHNYVPEGMLLLEKFTATVYVPHSVVLPFQFSTEDF